MQEILYDIHSKRPLIVGYAGEHNACKVTFRGFKHYREDSAVHLMIVGLGVVALIDEAIVIQYGQTEKEGTYEAYLVELTEDDSLIHKSNNFEVIIKHSAPLGNLIPEKTPEVDYWTIVVSEQYHRINRMLADGELKGEKGDPFRYEDFTPEQLKDLKGKDGYTPVKGKDYRDGIDGKTPEKGLDYFTEEDKEEIAAKVHVEEKVIIERIENPYNDQPIKKEIDEIRDGLSATLKKPIEGIEVGKYFRVAGIDSEGNPILEYIDLPLADYVKKLNFNSGFGIRVDNENVKGVIDTTQSYTSKGGACLLSKGTFENIIPQKVKDNESVSDVQIGDTSIVGEDGIGRIPANERNTPSLFVIDNAKGINVRSDGTIGIGYASNKQIDSRGQIFCPIVPATIDYAVKQAMCDGKGASWTSTEQASARQRLGLDKEWVLKGTMTMDNISEGVNVDMTDCTEMIVYCKATTSKNVSLTSNVYRIAYNCIQTSKASYYCRFRDGLFGMEFVVARNGTTESAINTYINDSGNGDCWFGNKFISDITNIKFDNPTVISSCYMEIYAR